MCVRRGGPRRRKFLGRENFLQFMGGPSPVSRRLGLKCAWHRAPAGVFNEDSFLCGRGGPVFALNSLQRADSSEIRLSLFP